MTSLLFIILASILVSSVSFAGAAFLVWKNFFSANRLTALVSFAAGVMLASAFFDLLPEAAEMNPDIEAVFSFTFAGIVTFFLLERFVVWFHHHDHAHGKKPAALLVLIGDSLHNVIDGVAIAAAFIASPVLGITTTLAICAHEIPQEIGDFGILVEGGYSKKKALLFNFLSGLTALIGAILGYFFLERIEGVTWMFLSFSAGMFIYISCSDLIPELHKDFHIQRRWQQTLPFIIGVVLLWLMVRILEG